MLPENPKPGSARDWLRRAKSDLALSSVARPPDVMYNELCFHAQQAVEKSLKAVLIAKHIEFRRVHHIGYLLGLLPQETTLPPEAIEAVGLTSYAVMTRYPGDYEEITREMYQEAVQIARYVVGWAEKIVEKDIRRQS